MRWWERSPGVTGGPPVGRNERVSRPPVTKCYSAAALSAEVAVGTGLAASPPRRSRRAAFPHRAPVLGDTIAPFGFGRPMQLRNRTAPAQVTRRSGSAPGACVADRSPLDQAPSLHPLRSRSRGVVRGLPRYYAPVRLLRLVHHRLRLLAFPMRAGRRPAGWPNRRSPRFRRNPFLRDVVFDHGRATAPRMPVPHVLPSTLLTVSASANFELSRLNSTPHRIAVYASCPSSPTTTQHSLSGARYGLPVPVFHRLDRASFPGAQAITNATTPCEDQRSRTGTVSKSVVLVQGGQRFESPPSPVRRGSPPMCQSR